MLVHSVLSWSLSVVWAGVRRFDKKEKEVGALWYVHLLSMMWRHPTNTTRQPVASRKGIARRTAVCGPVAYTWDVYDAESVSKCFLLQVPKVCIRNVLKRSVSQNLEQWLMVNSNDEVLKP